MTTVDALTHAYGDRRTALRYAATIRSVHQPAAIRADVMVALEPHLEALWLEVGPDLMDQGDLTEPHE